jgi:hypothetical protein
MYGICRLAVIPLRAEPNHKSEMLSQLLFGEHYTVEEELDEWLKIRNAFDEYVGYIPLSQHTAATQEYFQQVETHDYKISLELLSPILYKKERMHIVIGSILPFTANELFKMEESLAFAGEAKPLSQIYKMPLMKDIAFRYLNAPYLWGGRSPMGVDCSGFTQQVFKICGFRLYRDAYQQHQQGAEVKYHEAKAADLAFFASNDKVDHVGLILDDYKIIHASGRVKVEQITEEGIVDANKKLTHKLVGIKRIIL